MSAMLEYALKYAELGWKVFPLKPGLKVPATQHGVRDATTDVEQIKTWWTAIPGANIGLACGAASGGIHVIDIDLDLVKEKSGFAALKERKIVLPRTVSQCTPRGGMHLLYRTEAPIGNKVNFIPGVDIRGDGGYIVVNPSHLAQYDGCPDGGAYEWLEGFDPWTHEIMEYPECMRSKPKVMVAPVSEPIQQTVAAGSFSLDIQRRASRWLAMADAAVQGMGGHDKLFWACQGMVSGFCLSDQEAFSLLASEYNPRCQPPWDLSDSPDFKDFSRKIQQARANPPRDKPIGWLLNDPLYAEPTCVIDYDSLLSKVVAKEGVIKLASVLGASIDYDHRSEVEFLSEPTGYLGKLCGWINGTSIRSQPMLTLACCISWLGALYGRKIEDESGMRTNVYCLGIAKSSAGKDHAPRQIRRLAHGSGQLGMLGGGDLSSDASIEARLEKSPSCLFMFDEIWNLLASVKSRADKNKVGIVTTFMRLYSSAQDVFIGKEYADSENQRIIVEPNCCIYGMSTPDRFSNGISPEEIDDGWLSRCLIFYSATRPEKKEKYIKIPVPEDLLEECIYWSTRGMPTGPAMLAEFVVQTGPGELSKPSTPMACQRVEMTDEAKAAFKHFNKSQESLAIKDESIATILMKSEENAKRIALICAASENREVPLITGDIADYACRLIRYLAVSFIDNVVPDIVDSKLHFDKRKIARLIGSGGTHGRLKRFITQKTQWTDRSHRDSMLGDLMEAGDIIGISEGKTIRFFTPNNAPEIPNERVSEDNTAASDGDTEP